MDTTKCPHLDQVQTVTPSAEGCAAVTDDEATPGSSNEADISAALLLLDAEQREVPDSRLSW